MAKNQDYLDVEFSRDNNLTESHKYDYLILRQTLALEKIATELDNANRYLYFIDVALTKIKDSFE